MHHPETRNPASCFNSDRVSTRTGPGKQTETESRSSPSVIQLPTTVVAAEADADTPGWHVRVRRDGRLIFYRDASGFAPSPTRKPPTFHAGASFGGLHE